MSKLPYFRKIADRPDSPILFVASRLHKLSLRRPKQAALQFEHRLCGWTARHGLTLTRISLGIIFFWFGALKLLPTSTPIDALAEHTIGIITLHLVSPLVSLHILGVWECLIGIGLLFGIYLRAALLLLFLHLPGTFLPLVLFPHTCWIHFPFFPSLIGHYILKNFVLISAGIVIAASSRGGRIIANPAVATRAGRLELLEEERVLLAAEGRASGMSQIRS